MTSWLIFVFLVLLGFVLFISDYGKGGKQKILKILVSKKIVDNSSQTTFLVEEQNQIRVFSPRAGEKIKSPVRISGEARGFWFFEAQFIAELYDAHQNFLGRTILTAKNDWMTEAFVPFEGSLEFTEPSTSLGTLRFLSANPSGLTEKQKVFELPIQFEAVPYKKVLLYYYQPEKDKDETGAIRCSRNGLVPIEREIPLTKTPIQDVINLLLRGKENLKPEEIASGITTDYPLPGFRLESVDFEPEGRLILKFADPLNQTSGGACRVGILWFQIEATAKQFSGVKQVKFLPEGLFQP